MGDPRHDQPSREKAMNSELDTEYTKQHFDSRMKGDQTLSFPITHTRYFIMGSGAQQGGVQMMFVEIAPPVDEALVNKLMSALMDINYKGSSLTCHIGERAQACFELPTGAKLVDQTPRTDGNPRIWSAVSDETVKQLAKAVSEGLKVAFGRELGTTSYQELDAVIVASLGCSLSRLDIRELKLRCS